MARRFILALRGPLTFLIAFITAAVRRRPLELKPYRGTGPKAWLTPDGHLLPLIAGAEGADDSDDSDDDDDSDDSDSDDDSSDDDDSDDDDQVTDKDDWKSKARKHERAAKRERRRREAAEKKLKDKAEKDKTDLQKAIDDAREEGKQEALSEAEKTRRADRLEVAITRLAAKGVEVEVEGKDGKSETKTLRFADPEDAQVFIERAITREDIDQDDIFEDNGKVNTEALSEELAGLLKRKPRLAVGAEGSVDTGDPDTRKGDRKQKDLEAMTPEDHARRKYGDQK